ncbi:MAG: acetyl-CoA C-acyltransferase, partial [Pyrinomonadaceae bacterium]|nr:acetyl-CoA C-acyltransferase [Pyrinomonadaceae bacterium]
MARDVFILAGKRTPMCEYVGALKDVKAIDLGAAAARGALEATGVAADEIDHTIVGNALQTSGDAIYGARHVALKAGVPADRPALTVNRLCGSGIQSIISGAQMIQLGEAETALVGGMESMSQAPHVIYGARSGFPLGQGKLEDSLMVALLDTYCNTTMAGTAENLARR